MSTRVCSLGARVGMPDDVDGGHALTVGAVGGQDAIVAEPGNHVLARSSWKRTPSLRARVPGRGEPRRARRKRGNLASKEQDSGRSKQACWAVHSRKSQNASHNLLAAVQVQALSELVSRQDRAWTCRRRNTGSCLQGEHQNCTSRPGSTRRRIVVVDQSSQFVAAFATRS